MINRALRVYTAGIGIVCAGSVVMTLQARHEADAATKTASVALVGEKQKTAYWNQIAASAVVDDKGARQDLKQLAARYNTLVVRKRRDDRRYAGELRRAQAAANAGRPTTYVGGGTSYAYSTVTASSGGSTPALAPAAAPASQPATATS